ncbi:MAG: MFS transporter [Lachnospiraceae bacterium]|nr:MFS transporter [Lachnospiraceae bacterium]MBQ9136945.1 MFS transporter [Lachnospiraceae bacterium]
MGKKLNYRRTFLIGLAFLSISSFWQLYDNIIPLMLQNTFGLGETVTGIVMALDNVLAVFLLPVFGTLSDKVDTRLGKRTPFIIVGTALAVIFMLILPIADKAVNLPLFVGALFGALVAMGLYRSPAVALMPDLTPNRLRSKGNAVINLLGAVGGVSALILIKLLVGKGLRPDYTPLFMGVALLMVIAIIILVLTVREKKIAAIVAEEEAVWAKENPEEAKLEALKEAAEKADADKAEASQKTATVLAPEVKKSMFFMLASVFFWYAAYNAVTTAFSRYTVEVWKLEGGGFADCLMVATVAAIISYIPIGLITAKFGRKKIIMGGVLLMAACYLAAFFVTEYTGVINIAFALIGVAWAAINVNSYPMVVAMGQGADIGKFTGTYYTFSMAAQIITPVLSGALLENVSYATLFPYAFVFSMLAFGTMSLVKHGDVKPVKKDSILENFDVED